MPKQSDRQSFLQELVEILAVAALEEEYDDILGLANSDGEEDLLLFSIATEASELLQLVQSSRYLVRRERSIKSTVFKADAFRYSISDSRFRGITRMDRRTFSLVVDEIKGNPVFSNNSYCSQAEVWMQLAVALDRFANYGTGASLSRSQGLWGIDKGTVDDYTDRVVTALNDLSEAYVRWPSEAERRKSSRSMTSLGFRGCVGFIDGTTIPLAQKPAKDGECFFDRKHRYSLNGQVVCDWRRRIIAFFRGWPGSCSDSTIYQEMTLSKDEFKHHFFSCGEYLLADFAYPADLMRNSIVPAYKSNVRGTDIEDFNTCVAHARVVNEHTIGVLKNRWGSLKELRTQINREESMESVLKWITACITLHNMMIDFNDEWSDSERSSSEEEDDENCTFDYDDDDPFLFRRDLKRRAIVKGREPGGILWLRSQQALL